MRIPFPEIDSKLARDAHMYICLENEQPKKFLKCQSAYKHLKDVKKPPYQFVEVAPNIKHNPFRRPTLVDCDKSFVMNHEIVISEKLLTTRRRDISEAFFGKLKEKIKHKDFKEVVLDAKVIVQLNDEIVLAEH